ncbi:GPI-anchored micronemal antigen [Plasmodium gonderi]|uniref:GPI-anchored micronemal antigen n=1 Tax=Plasmodium gonderi TaxID=77519 RepID=A0A1Y1JD56_PLAGO|nr:GPI-anchored micronemal antigen [Plasmodium gonderi]GAW79618.1 GPI-anchored micronemal antigen [Plasmodium gonderi]
MKYNISLLVLVSAFLSSGNALIRNGNNPQALVPEKNYNQNENPNNAFNNNEYSCENQNMAEEMMEKLMNEKDVFSSIMEPLQNKLTDDHLCTEPKYTNICIHAKDKVPLTFPCTSPQYEQLIHRFTYKKLCNSKVAFSNILLKSFIDKKNEENTFNTIIQNYKVLLTCVDDDLRDIYNSSIELFSDIRNSITEITEKLWSKNMTDVLKTREQTIAGILCELRNGNNSSLVSNSISYENFVILKVNNEELLNQAYAAFSDYYSNFPPFAINLLKKGGFVERLVSIHESLTNYRTRNILERINQQAKNEVLNNENIMHTLSNYKHHGVSHRGSFLQGNGLRDVPSATSSGTENDSKNANDGETENDNKNSNTNSNGNSTVNQNRNANANSNTTSAPGSSQTSTPASSQTSAPGSSQTSTPASSQTSAPGSSQTSTPASSQTSTPASSQTSTPTSAPASVPTSAPASVPTSAQTSVPTSVPTSAQTSVPTSAQTSVPTSAQTSVPTSAQTSAPTTGPNDETRSIKTTNAVQSKRTTSPTSFNNPLYDTASLKPKNVAVLIKDLLKDINIIKFEKDEPTNEIDAEGIKKLIESSFFDLSDNTMLMRLLIKPQASILFIIQSFIMMTPSPTRDAKAYCKKALVNGQLVENRDLNTMSEEDDLINKFASKYNLLYEKLKLEELREIEQNKKALKSSNTNLSALQVRNTMNSENGNGNDRNGSPLIAIVGDAQGEKTDDIIKNNIDVSALSADVEQAFKTLEAKGGSFSANLSYVIMIIFSFSLLLFIC